MKASLSPTERSNRTVWIAASIFALIGCLLQWWRLQSLTASMDQGILMQVLWNGLHGHAFESTLSSQLSTNVAHSGELPTLGYHRLGQHFTPTLALWIPLVGVMGKWALPMLQVGLITAAGLVLHRLAKDELDARLASWIALAFYGANAVIAPCMLANFTDLSQLPLCVFVLLLGLRRQSIWLSLPAALAMPLIREDTGVVLVGIGLWLLIRERRRWPLAAALILYGGGWVVVVTNLLMPMFSDDNSKRFMVENFGQYIEGQKEASSLEVLGLALQQPWILLRELVSPPIDTITYLIAQGLPLLFIPYLALDSWILMGLPLTGLLLAQGFNNPLSINIRYTYLVVPGLFAGAVFWWKSHQNIFEARRFRRLWGAAILLSILFTVSGNPNRSLSWIIPDSIQPWVYRSPQSQLEHGRIAIELLHTIPPDATVAATTGLVPHLAAREVLIRFPYNTNFNDRTGTAQPVEWLAVDLHNQIQFKANQKERRGLERNIQTIQELGRHGYGIVNMRDDVVLMQLGQADQPSARQTFEQLRQSL